jgi:poly(3-hydroxybutyrate) depolymerase
MPIGEFGGAAALPGDGSPFLSAPMYWFYEMGHAALTPARAFADAGRIFYKNPANPFAHTRRRQAAAAAFELFERTTRATSQPDWGIDSTLVGGERAPVHIVPIGSGRSVGCCISSARSSTRRSGRSRSC